MTTRYLVPCYFQLMFTEKLLCETDETACKMFNRFTITCRSNDFFVTFWKLICSHDVTPCWLNDAKELIQSVWSKQRDSCSLAHEILTVVAGCFESCGHVPFDQKFRFEFPKFPHVKWNSFSTRPDRFCSSLSKFPTGRYVLQAAGWNLIITGKPLALRRAYKQ